MRLKEFFRSRDARIIVVDLIMMAILIANLLLILFDLLFSSSLVQNFFKTQTPDFYQFYLTRVHQDFFAIDMWFVAVFLLELFIRWGIAIKNHTYYKWFFYPFIHWYDVLGCIPVGSFRFLRVLRVISIVVRLQKLKIIDITRTYIFAGFNKYLNILTEEVSDRVVVNVLSGIQDEIEKGNPIATEILEKVVEPQKGVVVEWVSHRMQRVISDTYDSYRDDLRDYVQLRISEAVDDNQEITNIAKIPVMGPIIADNLQKAIYDIVYNVIDKLIQDLGSPQNKMIISDLAHLSLSAINMEEKDRQLDKVARSMVVQSLELIKDQVKVQQWKIKEEEEKEQRLRQRMEGMAKS